MWIKEQISKAFQEVQDKVGFLNEIKGYLSELSPIKDNPVDKVIWVKQEDVIANNYNPNHVAPKELSLLHNSIKEDGYTQPIVTIYDEEINKYVIVDGFHRNLVGRKYSDIKERCMGYLPIVVMEKNINQRMASTVRHNRARGSHSVEGMTNIIFSMMKEGCSEMEICQKLGLEKQEFNKLKYITGFAKLFKNYEYSKAVDKFISQNKLKNEN